MNIPAMIWHRLISKSLYKNKKSPRVIHCGWL